VSIPVPRVSEIFEQRYELLEVLGSGGIGTVFKARQIDANRLLALKILHAEIRDDQEFKARFLREAQSLNKLRHPNIVTLYHLGISEDGLPYIAMELINGVPLRKLLSTEKKLSVSRAIHIMKQLCSALSAMHAEGIVHRDLKPENIVLMAEPEKDFVKIIDFGLVRVEQESDQQKLTATGFLLGSVNYMSPEQCRGFKVDSRSDIYALGICFFEMLTGKCPFQSDSPVGTMYKHNSENTPVIDRTTVSTYHPSINELIQRATAKKPEQRFQTAEEISQALDLLSDTISGVAPNSWFHQPLIRNSLIASMGIILFLCVAVYLKSKSTKKVSTTVLAAPAKAPPLYIAKGHFDVAALDDKELGNLLEDPKTPMFIKIPAANRYSYLHHQDLMGLKTAYSALKMVEQLDAKGKSLYKENTQVALAEALVGNNKLEEAQTLLEQLLPEVRKSAKMQNYLKLRSLHAMICDDLGKKKEAISDLKELADWQFGLSHPTSINALRTALHLKEIKLARRICSQSTKLSDSVEMARICRRDGYMDLAEESVQHGLTQKADISLLHIRMAGKHLLTEHALFRIEEAWVDVYHKDFTGARKRVESITTDKEMNDAIEGNTEVKKAIAEIMQRLSSK
jgi:serine/threonine protein kinase